MGRMRRPSQTIQGQNFQTAKAIHTFFGYLAKIRYVAKVINTICHYRQLTVNYLNRSNQEVISKTERRPVNDCMRYYLGKATSKVVRLKDVLKNPLNIDPRPIVGVKTKRTITKI